MHIRQQIRMALVTALTGLPSTGSHVFVNAVYDIDRASLPALIIHTLDEQVSIEAQFGRRTYQRVLSVSIEAVSSSAVGLDDILDQCAVEVEAAINADVTLGDVAFDATLTGLSHSSEKGAQAVTALSLDYDILYVTEA